MPRVTSRNIRRDGRMRLVQGREEVVRYVHRTTSCSAQARKRVKNYTTRRSPTGCSTGSCRRWNPRRHDGVVWERPVRLGGRGGAARDVTHVWNYETRWRGSPELERNVRERTGLREGFQRTSGSSGFPPPATRVLGGRTLRHVLSVPRAHVSANDAF